MTKNYSNIRVIGDAVITPTYQEHAFALEELGTLYELPLFRIGWV
jgi:hypothetical protein